jgi:HlyD family secretion protein
MHVVVYVDEPDLGRVRLGLPVAITWDALPGRAWSGSVDRLPTQIQPLDSRQVGEVTCIINNPNLDLIPGANATVRIRTEVVEDAISIPKEAVFHMDTQAGVFLLAGDRLKWLPITEGVSNVTRVQVQELKEGDVIAQMTTDRTLTDGMQIRPLLPK